MALTVQEVAAAAEYWNHRYAEEPLEYDVRHVAFKDLFQRILPQGGTCFEVGCYPGRYLIHLGRTFGYRVSGIDATDRVQHLQAHLSRNGVEVGTILQGDFFSMPVVEKYDVVCSFGFIEHFAELENTLRLHARLVRPGGMLVITCPNFRYLQWLAHRLLDAPNLRRHVTETMSPCRWTRCLGDQQFSPIHVGYYGCPEFWSESPDRTWIQWKAITFLRRVSRARLCQQIPANRLTAPHIVGFYRRSAS